MNCQHKNIALYVGLIFISLGVLFIFAENTFYQYVDENGILHESLFLPLGVFSVLLGFIVILLVTIAKIRNIMKRRVQDSEK